MTMQTPDNPDEIRDDTTGSNSGIPQDDFIEDRPAEPVPAAPVTDEPAPPPAAAPEATAAPSELQTPEEEVTGFDRTRIRSANEQVRCDPKDHYSEPHGKIHRIPLSLAITLPSVPSVEINALSDSYGETTAESERTTDWLQQIALGANLINRGDALYKTQFLPDSEWVRRPEVEGERLGVSVPRYGDESQGGLMTGARARQFMRQAIGMGTSLRVPLWHSGIWVSFEAPGDEQLLELNSRVDAEKVAVGRALYGMLFSNTSVVTNELLIDFALQHVYQSTVNYTNVEELKGIIQLADMPTLIWGLMCTLYPNGFPYERPCVTGPEKCTYVVRETLALGKLSFTNRRALTAKQEAHMKKRKASYSLADIKAYQAEHNFRTPKTIDVGHGLRVEFRNPTLTDYIASGHAWIDNLVKSVDEAFGADLSQDERDLHVIRKAQVTAIRQYAHYIERVVAQDDRAAADRAVEDRQSLEEVLSVLSADATIYQQILDGVGAYIESTTMSMIAIPRYNCPNCDHDQGIIPPPDDSDAEPRIVDTRLNPVLIPLDVGQLFFTLIGRRLSMALSKRLV